MAISASLLLSRIPPFFGPEGGDVVAVGQLTWAFIVFSVTALIIKRNARK